MRLGPNPDAPPIAVVGIVGDVRNDPARPDAEAMAYAPLRANPWHISLVMVRTTSDPQLLVEPMRRELTALDPGIPLDRVAPLRGVIAEGLSTRRLPEYAGRWARVRARLRPLFYDRG